ncbi:MAG TPA: hypothetical protein VF290_05800 [Pyrinomonadaceae bacterium]
MKMLLCALVLLVFPLRLQAQEADRTKLAENVYYRALVAVLAARAQDAKYASANDPLQHVIILKDHQINTGFPSRVGEVEIEYLTMDELRARYRSLKREFPIFIMRAMSNDGHRLVISFTRHWVTAAKRTNELSLEGGYTVVIGFDCVRKELVVESAKLWGI